MACWYSLKDYFQEKFGGRVLKIPVNAGFTCPNRDGTRGTGGCIYCDNAAFSPVLAQGRSAESIEQQIENGTLGRKGRVKNLKGFVAYFQSFSNTHGPVDRLKALYDKVLGMDDIIGMAVGTRPDCVDEEKIRLLASYTGEKFVSVEYGLQSANDETLQRINRGHTADEFRDAVLATAGKNIHICAHVILFLPGESTDDMMHTANFISGLPVDSVKIHHLHIVRGTQLEREYAEGRIQLPSAEEYIPVLCSFIEQLRPDMVVQRIMGDTPRHMLEAPDWTLEKNTITELLKQEFKRRSTRQGDRHV